MVTKDLIRQPNNGDAMPFKAIGLDETAHRYCIHPINHIVAVANSPFVKAPGSLLSFPRNIFSKKINIFEQIFATYVSIYTKFISK